MTDLAIGCFHLCFIIESWLQPRSEISNIFPRLVEISWAPFFRIRSLLFSLDAQVLKYGISYLLYNTITLMGWPTSLLEALKLLLGRPFFLLVGQSFFLLGKRRRPFFSLVEVLLLLQWLYLRLQPIQNFNNKNLTLLWLLNHYQDLKKNLSLSLTEKM